MMLDRVTKNVIGSADAGANRFRGTRGRLLHLLLDLAVDLLGGALRLPQLARKLAFRIARDPPVPFLDLAREIADAVNCRNYLRFR